MSFVSTVGHFKSVSSTHQHLFNDTTFMSIKFCETDPLNFQKSWYIGNDANPRKTVRNFCKYNVKFE